MPRLDIPEPPFITSLSKKENDTINEWLLQIHNLLSGIGEDGTPLLDDDNIASLSLTSVTGDTDDLSEGTTNTYYTDSRADARVTIVHDAISGSHSSLKQSASDADSTAIVTSADAGAAYGAGEQTLINEIKGDVNTLVADHNDLLAKLRTASIIAT